MNQEELDIILENHGKWLRNEGGEKADLSNADLKNTNLRFANLRLADLSNADLKNTNLRLADLRLANLSNANLSNADLSYANLSYADLSYANLSYANLSNVDLNWVNWQHVEGLTVICVQVDTTRKNNQIAYIKELDIWITGCFQGTLDELKASVEQTHGDNEKLRKRYYRVIDFILKEVAE
ncbi:pentapeptide repeat-containing protein [Listeria monocytogenes]|nr:pentapeptide repeat-containing protein [Listeria monocytogenes]ECW3433512.1 pentapeptide repeat-containing protein [Listeria monocytogenes]MCQ28187.1 pentapeptide repeat-containing protein [Listeria monocytogenes]